jgi:hypothetical protein
MSDAFERFKFSFFADENSARDGLDTAALAELAGAEREQAEAMLIDYLPDTRGVIGLGVLHARRAEPQLARLFESRRHDRDDPGLVDLAKTLWQIRPDPRWLATLVDVLAGAGNEMQRMHAAMALAVFADPAAVTALTTALDDAERLVRHHAARALLTLHGLASETDVMTAGSDHMMYRVMAADAVRRDSGKRDVLAAIAGRAIVAGSCRMG